MRTYNFEVLTLDKTLIVFIQLNSPNHWGMMKLNYADNPLVSMELAIDYMKNELIKKHYPNDTHT